MRRAFSRYYKAVQDFEVIISQLRRKAKLIVSRENLDTRNFLVELTENQDIPDEIKREIDKILRTYRMDRENRSIREKAVMRIMQVVDTISE